MLNFAVWERVRTVNALLSTFLINIVYALMKKYDICCVGHITLDKIVTPKLTAHLPGGTAFYFAHAMGSLKADGFILVTSLAQSEMKAVDDIRKKKIEVKVIPSRNSVYFENKYGENQDNREQRVLAKADPFGPDSLDDVDARYFHFGSLLADDFSLDLIKTAHDKGIVAVDAQGYLREVRGEKVHAVDWPDKQLALPFIDILKVNEHEAEVLTGTSDIEQAARILAGYGVKEVILTLGSMGSTIYADGQFHSILAYAPAEVVDATGCGDTYMAGYLYKRAHGADYDEAGRFAAAMCTLKLQATGPFTQSEAEVASILLNAE